MSERQTKLLVAGGGYADIPLILSAKALGFYVITSGNRIDDLGHQYSHEYQLADFSDPSAMVSLARDLDVDAVCPCCNDFSALSAAYVAEKLCLPGHDPFETAKIVHHKDHYREFARSNGIPTPIAAGFDSIVAAIAGLEQFRYPVIVKPVDLTGGKGITKASTVKEGVAAVKIAFERSRAKRIVIEEFIEGSRHGISTFVRDGKVVFHFFDDEYYYKNPYLVSAACTPGSVSAKVINTLISTVEKIVDLLALKTGIVHVQYVLSHDEQPVIIEICRRAPGDLYISLVRHATGVDYSKYIIQAAAGMDCSDLRQVHTQGFYTRHCIMASNAGLVRNIVFDESIRDNIIDDFLWWKPGDYIKDFLNQKFGIVFLRFDSQAEMHEKTSRMQELIRVDITS